MAVTYKDINLLGQKASISGTEKIEVSDTEYITPNQIIEAQPKTQVGSLPIDSAPVYNSPNLVSSGGVYSAIAGKQKVITISSSEPTSADGEDGDIWIVI